MREFINHQSREALAEWDDEHCGQRQVVRTSLSVPDHKEQKLGIGIESVLKAGNTLSILIRSIGNKLYSGISQML